MRINVRGIGRRAWEYEGGIALSYTSEITAEDLPEDDVLRLSSGIFQRKVEKKYELRVTYIGSRGVAAKLLTQEHPKTRLDWRRSYEKITVAGPEDIPSTIDLACRKLMAQLGIVFGCFDLVVTPEGEYVFLEVNEMGQFLWIEDLNPEIMLLDPFCELLAQRNVNFEWIEGNGSLRLQSFMGSALSQVEEILENHVTRRPAHIVSDYDSRKEMGPI